MEKLFNVGIILAVFLAAIVAGAVVIGAVVTGGAYLMAPANPAPKTPRARVTSISQIRVTMSAKEVCKAEFMRTQWAGGGQVGMLRGGAPFWIDRGILQDILTACGRKDAIPPSVEIGSDWGQ